MGLTASPARLGKAGVGVSCAPPMEEDSKEVYSSLIFLEPEIILDGTSKG